MSLIDEAIVFATKAHSGQKRKLNGVPYILHPMEVASIVATMTTDEDVMIAGLLHDTIEDCGVDPLEISEKFGTHVFALVQSETEDKHPNRPIEESWQDRKEESLLFLKNTKNRDIKILWLADKLSNTRSFYREFVRVGDDVWNNFHQKDKKKQEWYYRTIAEYLKDLEDTPSYQEYIFLVNQLFGEEK